MRPYEVVNFCNDRELWPITDKYIDVELRERHNSAKQKCIKPEFINDE